MAVILLAIGSLIATVQILKPEKLTPLVTTAVNRMLNADVDVARVELRLKGHYPFLNISVDSLTVTSRDIKSLDTERRQRLPVWADTLLTIDRLSGGINLPQALIGKIRLSDVVIDAPGVNMVTADSIVNNYTVAGASGPDKPEETPEMQIPDIGIRSFAIINPRPIRYANIPDSLYAEIRISDATIADMRTDSLQMPLYNISVHTNLSSPLLRYIQGQTVALGCNGDLSWNHRQPCAISLSDFDFAVSELGGSLDAAFDFTDTPTLQTLRLELKPMSVTRVLDMISDESKQQYGIPTDLRTDMEIALKADLLDAYAISSGRLPHLRLTLEIPDSYVRWRRLDLRHVEVGATVTVPNDDPDSITVDIERITVAGPATALTVKGAVTSPASNPAFDGTIIGDLNLNNLPPILTRRLNGATLRGHLKMNTSVRASASMLHPNRFHNMRVRGSIDGRNIWYAAADTSTVLLVSNMQAKFGTNESVVKQSGDGNGVGRRIDNMLTASITVDSARILNEGISVTASKLRLGLGTKNRPLGSDTTAVIPLGGNLTFDRLAVTVLQDSAMLSMRRLNGLLTIQRYQGDTHLPLLSLNADIGMIGAGARTMRCLVRNAHLDTRMHKRPAPASDSARVRRYRTRTDSVTADTSQVEKFDFGTTREMRRLMRNWHISGTLSADRAGLFTSAFPLRNRIDSLRMTFCNDSVVLHRTHYRGGKSDFVASGSITNIQRAVASARSRQPLRISLRLESDTIDINQIAEAFFTGAANTEVNTSVDLDENSLDDDIVLVNKNDSVGPLLIPVNIDATIDAKARNVLYSDLLLHDFSGRVSMHDGALNLSNLQASSSVGSIDFSALYCAPRPSYMKFGMAMDLKRFNIRNFLSLMPAIDSIMPMIGTLGGIISAKIAATSDVDTQMNLVLPSLRAAINIEGDSLVFLDPATFKTISKWLMFKDKNKNMINHASAEMIIENNRMQMFPFIFDFDRYRLGVQGTNDLDLNYNYHVAVLKSPLPFKFGINIKGNAEDFKMRIGKARLNEKQSLDHTLVDTTRVNLIRQFEDVFRRGISNSQLRALDVSKPAASPVGFDDKGDTISAADSLYMKQNGLFNE